MKTTEELFIKMVLDAWYTHVKRTNDVIYELSDERLMDEVAPGRNRGIYLLGHLAAVHDRMLPLLGLGSQLQPELYKIFVESPDKAVAHVPSTGNLRAFWNKINDTLAEGFNKLSVSDWFQKHNAVSEEDFRKEPHRNKLNIIINRTNHLASHLGQLIFLRDKNE